MRDFNLDQSVEYQKIKETRRIIASAAAEGHGSLGPVFNAVSLIVNGPDNEFEIINDLTSTAKENQPAADDKINKETLFINKKKEMFNLLLRPELINGALNEFNVKLSKNIYSIYAISNFAFADYVFRYECETDELKRFRIGANEDPQAALVRNIRRKAEESYKNNKFDEAINFFKEANLKYRTDYTVYYQLGLIYFFEKADFKSSMENFRLASKYSHNKYNLTFIHSMVFTGLLLKLYALYHKDADMLNEAYQAIYQAYALDTRYCFSKYALAQCIASMGLRNDLIAQANSLIKNLIMSEKLFAIQIIHDPAYNSYIDELSKLFKNLYNELTGSMAQLFEQLGAALELISYNQQYLTIPAKTAAVKAEYKKITEQINSKKTFFDIDSFCAMGSHLSNELAELSEEIERNKKYSETRAIVEAAINNYKENYSELTKQFTEVENNFASLKEEYIKLDSHYPNPEFDDFMASLLDTNGHIPDLEKKIWRDSGLFIIIKFISGSFTFLILVIIVIVLSTLFTKGITSFFGIAGILLSLAFMPLYATIFAEIYYNYIEFKRKSLITDLEKLKIETNVNKIKAKEIEKKVSTECITLITQQTHLSSFTSEKIFDACLNGNFEQIKSFIS
jgi:hypothetical protein